MVRSAVRFSVLIVAACQLFCAQSTAGAFGAVPQARVTPSKAVLRGQATIVGSNFRPNSPITLLLAIPDMVHPKTEQLLAASHSDSRGRVRVVLHMPVVTRCGSASVYLIGMQSGQRARARFQLTGCWAGSKGGVPPPPPSPHKP